MYFMNAVWYLGSTVGLVSMILAASMAFQIFNEKLIEAEFGYRNYFIVLGLYGLVALPLAATINGGTGPDFLFFLGCECPTLLIISNQLEARHKAGRVQLLAAQTQHQANVVGPPQLDPVLKAMQDAQDRRPYAPAPSSLVHDFDVPPQR